MTSKVISGLESVLEKLSRSLADKFGIRLIFQGDRCCTDGKNIYLPSLPDDIPKELLDAIHGWVDHECAHVTENTDMKVAKEFRERLGPHAFFLLNILEDLRVEEGMRKRFPGSGYNLARCYAFAIAEAAKEKSMHPMRQLAFAINTRVSGEADLPFVAPEIYAAVDTVGTIVSKAAKCASTRRVAALAEEAWKILEPLLAGQQQPAQSPQGQQSQQQPQGTPSGGENQNKGQSLPQEPGAASSPQTRGSAGEDASPQASGNTGEDSTAAGKADAGGSSETQPGTGAEESGQNAQGAPEGASPPPSGGEKQEAGDGAADGNGDPANGPGDGHGQGILGGLGEAIARQVRNYADSHQAYRVWSTKFDRVMLPSSSSYQTHAERMAAVMPLVAGVRQRLLQTLMAEPRARWRGDMNEGRVNPRALHRLVSASSGSEGTPRVFRRRERVKKLRTAVTLLVDESSSMGGMPIMLAAKTALVFCEALSRLNIATSVIGFSTANNDPNLKDAVRQTGLSGSEIRARYRTAPLRHTVYKCFGESFHKAAGRMDGMAARALTPLGESMLFAAKALAERHEERKVLFVLTDGRPEVGAHYDDATFNHAKESIKRIEKAGMDVALLGIMTSVVDKLHHRSVVINRLNDLPRAAMRQLQSVLSR